MMKKPLVEFGIVLGGLIITGLMVGAVSTPCGPGCGFDPALVCAGGAGLLMLTPLRIWWRILCVLILLSSLNWAKSEWNAKEEATDYARKRNIETLNNIFKAEKGRWEEERREIQSRK